LLVGGNQDGDITPLPTGRGLILGVIRALALFLFIS
jgi:hypothetical protein